MSTRWPSTSSSADSLRARPILQIRLLGEFSLRFDGQMVRGVATMRQQSLLAWLLLNRGAPQSRRQLAFALWPDSSERQARTNLRRELHNLRRALPAAEQYLSTEMQTLQWRSSAPLALDVADFEQALAAAQAAHAMGDEAGLQQALMQAVAQYKGDLLPGCYDDWLLAERERLRQEYLRALEQLVGHLQALGDYRAAIGYAQQWLREDALVEEAYERLIRLYALSGDRARALRTYHACVTTLQRELGVEPGPAIQRAYEHLLKGGAPPEHVQPLPQTALIGTVPLVGRQEEWETLQARWCEAAGGRSQFVALMGEAGIGKTRLVEALLDWAARQGITVAQARCYASELGLAYAPVTDWLRGSGLRGDLWRLDDVWLTQVARLLPELLAEKPHLPAPEPVSESWQRLHFFEALARAVFVGGRPLVLAIDDLQWTDQETLAWLHYLLRYGSPSPLLIAATIRSTEIDDSHPLHSWLADLRGTDRLAEIELGPLNERDTAILAAHIAGAQLDAHAAARLYRETEGNPLFTVETVRVRAGQPADGGAVEAPLSPRIQAVIESRLAQLSPLARRVANLAAATGSAFTFEVLAEASQEDEDFLVAALDELWQRRITREQSDHDYDFSHNKIREVVYNNLSLANRRLLHRRIARAMETVHAADLDGMSQQIARQYEAAGVRERAIAYYRRAGQVAQGIYANADAIQLYSRALTLLDTLAETAERAEQELALQRMLSIAHRNRKGYAAAEVGQALSRARVLCQQLGHAQALGPILWGLFTFHFVRAELEQARALGEELFDLAREEENPAFLQQAHYALGGTLCSLGAFEASLEHFEQGIALYDVSQHRAQVAMFGVDLGVFSKAWSTHAQWHLGHLDRALQRSFAAVDLARELGHPFSQALAMAYTTMLLQFGGNANLVQEWAAATITFCAEHGVGYYDSWATILHGWALAQRGSLSAGIEQMREGLADFRDSASETRLPYYLSLLAEVQVEAGQWQEGLATLHEALQAAAKSNDEWYGAETQRLLGELLLQNGDPEEAEHCFKQSLDISRRQKSRTLELRTTVSLARLWQMQKRGAEASDMLARVLSGFPQRFDSADLTAATALLEELP